MSITAAVRSPLCPAPVSTRTLKGLKSQRVARSQRLAALKIIQATPHSVPANQGPQSKAYQNWLTKSSVHEIFLRVL